MLNNSVSVLPSPVWNDLLIYVPSKRIFRYLGYFRITCYNMLRMEEKVTRLIVGTSCFSYSGDCLYRLCDNCFTGNGCSCKESPKWFKDDFALLQYVSLEIPANKAVRGFGFGATTVRGK